ncbi:MAG TPA: recombinase family protein, partial [Candidatus Polarisedimenticolia bacterium]|nr:recombinase family protein [Candidatus Polarisedimenticolia bacterium]
MQQQGDKMKTKASGKRAFSYLRWSTDPQTWGDSERRQAEQAKSYCATHGLELCEQFTDRGVSAWRGANQKGELGRLLKVAKPGDVLLVEDCDRLSRQDWLTAANFLKEIVDRGVSVVTLANGSVITKENFLYNPGTFLPAILRSFLGNDENQKKSFRIKEAWAARKRRVVEEGKAIRQKLPAWLRWDKEADKPVLDSEKADVVRRMFQLALEGLGVVAIARNLTENGVRPIGRNPAKGWYSAFVWLTLKNKAAIGYCCHVDPPVAGVYPAVVDEKTFFAVQAKIRERHRLTSPRRYADNNLFTALAVCSKCGGFLMRHDQRNNGKTYHYLVCGNAKQGASRCGMASIGYDLFECSVLEIVSQFGALRKEMETKPSEPTLLQELEGKLMAVHKLQEKFLRAFEGDDNEPQVVTARLKVLDAQEKQLIAE